MFNILYLYSSSSEIIWSIILDIILKKVFNNVFRILVEK